MIHLTAEDRRKLELAGLIKPSAQVAVSSGKGPNVLLVSAPKVTHIIAPVARGSAAKRKWPMTEREARDQCICIHCRARPARYYGPIGGYGVGCDQCLDERAAARRAKR